MVSWLNIAEQNLSLTGIILLSFGLAMSGTAVTIGTIEGGMFGWQLLAAGGLVGVLRLVEASLRSGESAGFWKVLAVPAALVPLWYMQAGHTAALIYLCAIVPIVLIAYRWQTLSATPIRRAVLKSLTFSILAVFYSSLSTIPLAASIGLILLWGGASIGWEILGQFIYAPKHNTIGCLAKHGPLYTAALALGAYILAGIGAHLLGVLHVVIAAEIMTSYAAIAMPFFAPGRNMAVEVCAAISLFLHAWAPALQHLLN